MFRKMFQNEDGRLFFDITATRNTGLTVDLRVLTVAAKLIASRKQFSFKVTRRP